MNLYAASLARCNGFGAGRGGGKGGFGMEAELCPRLPSLLMVELDASSAPWRELPKTRPYYEPRSAMLPRWFSMGWGARGCDPHSAAATNLKYGTLRSPQVWNASGRADARANV